MYRYSVVLAMRDPTKQRLQDKAAEMSVLQSVRPDKKVQFLTVYHTKPFLNLIFPSPLVIWNKRYVMRSYNIH